MSKNILSRFQGNSKFKGLNEKYGPENVEKAAEYFKKSYSVLWETFSVMRKIKYIQILLEARERRGYGFWEIDKIEKMYVGR